MRVICEHNLGKDLPKRLLNEAMGFTASTRFAVTVGSSYVVYAMTLFLGDVWYYLCDDHYVYFPVWYPAVLFRVLDPRVSPSWQYSYEATNDDSDESMLLAFKEWAVDRRFYERLTDRDPEAVEIFKKYKELLDSEFV